MSENKPKEYIERGALLQDIEENVLFTVRGGAETPTPEMRGARKVIGRIEAVPAADVVEVVRCKDCGWFIAREEGAGDCDMIFGFTSPVSENGYCYCGKRKDGDNNATD